MSNSIDQRQKALILGTMAFTVSFAVWGLLSGLMPILKKDLGLSASEASLLLAVPVILGSLGRIPAGLLADYYGGKRVFSFLLFLIVLPTVALGFVKGYAGYLITAAIIGLGGTAFSVGIAFVSRWFPKEKQGTALGIYGAGNIGQSIAVFGAPLLASAFGISWAVWIFALLALCYGIYFFRTAEDAPTPPGTGSLLKSFVEILQNKNSWLLSIFYFQTFGGFVALSLYMPMLLKDLFGLTPADAGFRTAVFVVLATACRPAGGWLSDKFPPERLLAVVLLALIPCAFVMTSQDLGYFTAGALSVATLVGLGNGAVFKMVPEFFPARVGAATGLVGAAGGMGGFFPPIVLGLFKDQLGSYAPGFYCLAIFAGLTLVLLYLGIIRTGSCRASDPAQAEDIALQHRL